MKTSRLLHSRFNILGGLRVALLLLTAFLGVSTTAMGEILLVADPNGTNGVSSYRMDGSLINASLVSGTTYQGLAMSGNTVYIANPGPGTPNNGLINKALLDANGNVISSGLFAAGGGMNAPFGLLATSSNLYVADFNSGYILQYDYSSGLQTNSFWTGLTNPYALALSGDTLWVSQATTGAGNNTVKGYSLSAFDGTPTFTITMNMDLPHGLAVSGNVLYVANGGNGTIWSFDTDTGLPIGLVVSGLTDPSGLLVSGTNLYVSSADGTVKAFDTSTGNPLAGFTTITGLSSPNGLAIAPVPEPSVYGVIVGAAALGLVILRRRTRKTA